jgi:hypothetical protein
MKTIDLNIDLIIDIFKSELSFCDVHRSKKYLTVRCYECGDSKNPNHGHLNLDLDPEHLVWHCVRCNASGSFNLDFLKNLGIHNTDLFKLAISNKSYIKKKLSKNSNTFITKNRSKFKIPLNIDKKKLNYLNERFETSFNIDEIVKYKIITSFNDFLNYNGLNFYGNQEIFTKLQETGIGFLSFDRSHLIFRDISDTWEKRYFNYSIFKKTKEDSIIYSVANELSIFEEKIDIIVAEGIFDIVAVNKFNLFKSDNTKVFFSSNGSGGTSLINILKYLITLGYIDYRIIVFSDSDIDYNDYKELKMKNPKYFYNTEFRVFYNKLKKDCGRPLREIELKQIRIN